MLSVDNHGNKSPKKSEHEGRGGSSKIFIDAVGDISWTS